MHTHVIHNAYTAKEATEQCSRAGKAKATTRLDKMFSSAFLAGALLAFACAATLSTNTAPWYQDNAPGLIRMLGAVVFPWGLVAIVVTGADICTGNFMMDTVAVFHGRLSVWRMLLHWTVSFFGNLAGSLFVVGLVVGEGGVFALEPYSSQVFTFNEKKVVTPEWHMIFLRGIGANWLVCLACFLAFCAREFFSKVVAVWWPTFAFVCLGFDHVVANMFFVPLSIFLGDPQISIGYYIWKSMIPSLFGNMVGGGLMVGAMYWYLNLTSEPPILIDGAGFPTDPDDLVGVAAGAEPATPERRPSSEAKSGPEQMV